MSAKPEASIAQWKRELVDELEDKFDEYSAIGILDIQGIPAKQFQEIRDILRGKAEIKVSRKVLLRIAVEKVEEEYENLEELKDYLEGPSALIFTDMDPFRLKKLLDENSTTAPAKPGMAAPEDIVIPEGDTDFDPGPIVGELQGAGINARIQGGKVVVLEDSTVVEEGEAISEDVAGVLSRFDIEPREIGFDLKAAYADGTVFSKEVLTVNDEEELERLKAASQRAIKLAFGVDYPNERTVTSMVSEAASKSMNLAVNADVYNSETAPKILAKANQNMLTVSAKIASENSEALSEELKDKVTSPQAQEDVQEGELEEEKEEAVEEEETEEEKEDKKEEKQQDENSEGGEAGLGGLFD